MNKEYNRREFLKIMGLGTASLVLGSNLSHCKAREEEKMNIDRLIEYNVFKQHQTDSDFDDYLFIREHKDNNNYMYFYLSVSEDKYFYDNIYATIKKDTDSTIENDYVPFEKLLDNYNLEDLGNAFDVVSSVIGTKPYYMASEINQVPELLRGIDMSKKIKTR